MRTLSVGLLWVCAALASPVWAQAPAPGPSTLRVTVTRRDEPRLAARRWSRSPTPRVRPSRQRSIEQGVATFTGLQPGAYQMKVTAEGFREQVLPDRPPARQQRCRGHAGRRHFRADHVADQDADDRRDNGFTQTLTADEIDALSDDPDEMAEQLAQMAGPGAQIFVDGFRGGRLPPKDQIQQVRFNSNSFSAEYHEAGMVRVEVITRPGMGGWRGRANVGFRDESLNARNAFSPVKEPTEQQRYNFSFQGPLAKGKTGLLDVGGRQQRLRLANDSGAVAGRPDRHRPGEEHDRRAQCQRSASITHSARAARLAPNTSGGRPIAATSASGTSICPNGPTTPSR